MNAQESNKSSVLFLDNSTSLVLPYFDTSSIADSNISSIILSLYVIDINPDVPSKLQITINPINLDTMTVGDGLSAFVDAKKDDYVNFELPKELFEQTVRTQNRFIIRLVSKGSLTLQGSDEVGTVQDPRLTVVHGDIKSTESPDQPRIIENNYFNIEKVQYHFGSGDNVGNNKNVLLPDKSFWGSLLGQIIIGLIVATIIALIAYFYKLYFSK